MASTLLSPQKAYMLKVHTFGKHRQCTLHWLLSGVMKDVDMCQQFL